MAFLCCEKNSRSASHWLDEHAAALHRTIATLEAQLQQTQAIIAICSEKRLHHHRRTQMKQIAVVMLSCTIAACQRSESVPAASSPSHARGRDSTGTAQSASRDSAAIPTNSVLLALDGEGLRLVVESTGSTRLLAFGMESSDVITAMTRALGPPLSRGTNAECGAGPMAFAVFADGLSIVMQHDRFVGWSTRASNTGGTHTTMSGLGVGSTRAALDSHYVATVARSTLGEEFEAGGIAGVLDGESSSARITDMWAGVSCVAR